MSEILFLSIDTMKREVVDILACFNDLGWEGVEERIHIFDRHDCDFQTFVREARIAVGGLHLRFAAQSSPLHKMDFIGSIRNSNLGTDSEFIRNDSKTHVRLVHQERKGLLKQILFRAPSTIIKGFSSFNYFLYDLVSLVFYLFSSCL